MTRAAAGDGAAKPGRHAADEVVWEVVDEGPYGSDLQAIARRCRKKEARRALLAAGEIRPRACSLAEALAWVDAQLATLTQDAA